MKKIILFNVIILITFISCKKEQSDVANTSKIEVEGKFTSGSNLKIGPGGGVDIIYGNKTQVGPNVFQCPGNGICFLKVRPWYLGEDPAIEGFYGNFEKVGNSLVMNVLKASLTVSERNLYFNNNQFVCDKPKFFDEDYSKEIGFEQAYLIENGTYPIVSEDSGYLKIYF